MSNKKRSRKGIDSLKKQIAEHEAKLRAAREGKSAGLEAYYEKEISHLEASKERLGRRVMPKKKRKRF